mmetsp:Transcript_20264/g.64722  ORF Transcript_20264/g.64722 Transcript_20264/m.64722 type:complete len:372 (-) Transcript_20264:326-1441(-)
MIGSTVRSGHTWISIQRTTRHSFHAIIVVLVIIIRVVVESRVASMCGAIIADSDADAASVLCRSPLCGRARLEDGVLHLPLPRALQDDEPLDAHVVPLVVAVLEEQVVHAVAWVVCDDGARVPLATLPAQRHAAAAQALWRVARLVVEPGQRLAPRDGLQVLQQHVRRAAAVIGAVGDEGSAAHRLGERDGAGAGHGGCGVVTQPVGQPVEEGGVLAQPGQHGGQLARGLHQLLRGHYGGAVVAALRLHGLKQLPQQRVHPLGRQRVFQPQQRAQHLERADQFGAVKHGHAAHQRRAPRHRAHVALEARRLRQAAHRLHAVPLVGHLQHARDEQVVRQHRHLFARQVGGAALLAVPHQPCHERQRRRQVVR